jgi:ubiquinone/menaquinone biosynthesis C-methylase UbiE
MGDLADNRLRTRFEAWMLDTSADAAHEMYGAAKEAAIGAMRGTVVELGPGTGANMRYYAPGVHVIGLEPNPGMHAALREKARAHDVDLEIRTCRAEASGLPDASVDGAVGTLVLCGVDDPAEVLAEVRRILRPGATYFFLEHVVAPSGTTTHRAQRLLRRPHRWLFNGCVVDRDLGATIEAAGFASVDLECRDEGLAGLHVRHRIIGTAVA